MLIDGLLRRSGLAGGSAANGTDAVPTDAVRTDRIAVRVPGVHRSDAEPLRSQLRQELGALPGVSWAVVNAPLQRVVLGLHAPGVGREQIVAVVEAVRARYEDGAASQRAAAEPEEPPGPEEPPDDRGVVLRAGTALAADAAGLALATVGRVARWRPGPVEIASILTVVDTQPRLRGALERAVGRDRADVALAVGSALAQGAAQGLVGIGVDAALRFGQLTEVRARQAAWRRGVGRLLREPDHAAAEPVVTERPRPLPDGAVERYAPRSAALAGAGATLALAAGAGPRRAVAAALATLPKSSGAGREMFAAQLGRVLADRDVQVMDRRALRRLDRIDTVVLDLAALTTGRLTVADVIAMPEVDEEPVQLQAHAMFDPDAVTRRLEVAGWSLGPLHSLDLAGPTQVGQRRRLERTGVVAVLGLARERTLQALVVVEREPAHSADALVAAARRCGAELMLAGSPLPGSRPLEVRHLPAGSRLAGAVRTLQADGRVVLLVSRQVEALAAADVGVGVNATSGRPPWGAHVIVGDDLAAAALLIDAVDLARDVTRRGIQLAEVASALGAVTAATGTPRGASSRALVAVNGAAALALVQAAWSAGELARRPLSPPVSSVPWHLLPVPAVLGHLDATADGLTSRQARQRRRPDVQGRPEPVGPVRAFAEELANPLTPILASGAALSAAIGSVVDAGIVVGATAFGALAGAVQRTVTDRAINDLLARSAVVSTVRRDGGEHRVGADQLVPGDVVSLLPGDVVPADCRVLSADALELDESALTGESLPVAKTPRPVVASALADRTSMVYEGSTVAGGRGEAVVVATGASTEVGRSMATSRMAAPVAGVEARLTQLTRAALPVALTSGAAVMGAGLLRGSPVQQTLSAGVGLAVASVPEGLPFLVSAAQLAAARRLSQVGVLVRNARTVEALGRVDVLCFDKTGTLTQGRIALATVSPATPATDPADVLAAALRATPTPPPDGRLPHLTDRAVRQGAADLGVSEERGAPGWQPLSVLPFEPARGYHATLGTVRPGADADGDVLLSVKGAPELVLSRCVARSGSTGERPLSGGRRRRLHAELGRLTGRGLRVLAVAQAHHDGAGRPDQLTDTEVHGLTFLGFLALADPVRATAGASLEELRAAGAQIIMITGDHPQTAAAIGDELGIMNGHRVVTGSEIDELDDAALRELIPNVAVVARGTPAHKVRVVRALQAAGRVVAMTGDGANDAPAIRLADVGIALGQRGTPAARAAADLVVSDDRLETIVAALVEGRAMWRSVRQALAVLVGGNLGEIGFTVLGAALTGSSPLSARQFLLVNLFTDLAPALAIALRRPPSTSTEQLMREGPESSLGVALSQEIALRAGTTAIGATAGWLAARATGTRRRAQTVALASLVGTQLAQTVLLGGASPGVLGASIGSAVALTAVIQTPGVSQFFGCTPLGPVGWGITCGAAAGATVSSAVLPALATRLPQSWRSPERVEAFLDPDRWTSVLRDRLS